MDKMSVNSIAILNAEVNRVSTEKYEIISLTWKRAAYCHRLGVDGNPYRRLLCFGPIQTLLW